MIASQIKPGMNLQVPLDTDSMGPTRTEGTEGTEMLASQIKPGMEIYGSAAVRDGYVVLYNETGLVAKTHSFYIGKGETQAAHEAKIKDLFFFVTGVRAGIIFDSYISCEGAEVSTFTLYETGDQAENGIPAMNRALAAKARFIDLGENPR